MHMRFGQTLFIVLCLSNHFLFPQRPHAVPGRPHAVPGRPHAVPERWHAVPERWHTVPERCHAVPERWHAVPERWHAVPERWHAVPERCRAVPERCHAWLAPSMRECEDFAVFPQISVWALLLLFQKFFDVLLAVFCNGIFCDAEHPLAIAVDVKHDRVGFCGLTSISYAPIKAGLLFEMPISSRRPSPLLPGRFLEKGE